MFAGPNGSGKSSLKEVLPQALQGVYLNPDELEASLQDSGVLHLDQFALTGAGRALEQRIKALERPGHGEMKGVLLPSPDPDILRVNRFAVDSYMASALVESMREVLLEWGKTFTFETVMSHRSKVEILQRARDTGYRTLPYLSLFCGNRRCGDQCGTGCKPGGAWGPCRSCGKNPEPLSSISRPSF